MFCHGATRPGRKTLGVAGLGLLGLLPLGFLPLTLALSPAGRGDIFRPAQSILIGTHLHALLAADLDGDGKMDLAVTREALDQIEILYGRGAKNEDVMFDRAPPVPVGRNPFALAAADFTGDGRLDLAVATWGDDRVVLLLGTGGRFLRPTSPVPAGRHPSALAAADFNGDGFQDLAVADEGADQVVILLGTGVGLLRPGPTATAGRSPAALAVADFNADGRLDLAVANWEGHDVTILLGLGDGRFRLPLPGGEGGVRGVPVGREPVGLAAADFTGDGRLDLAVANRADATVSVLANRGGGLFQAVSEAPVGLQPSALAAADVTGDGRPDLAVANRGDNTVSVLVGRSDGTFFEASRLPAGRRPVALTAADLNADGRPDLAVTNEHGGDLSVFLRAVSPPIPGPPAHPSRPR